MINYITANRTIIELTHYVDVIYNLKNIQPFNFNYKYIIQDRDIRHNQEIQESIYLSITFVKTANDIPAHTTGFKYDINDYKDNPNIYLYLSLDNIHKRMSFDNRFNAVLLTDAINALNLHLNGSDISSIKVETRLRRLKNKLV